VAEKKTGYRLPYSKYYYIVSTFLVDHWVPPVKGSSNSLSLNVSHIPT